jgi:hypothetical protein
VCLGCLVRLRFALRRLAMWCVCAVALSFVSGWRAFSSVSLCKSILLCCLGLSRAPCLGLGCLVRLRFALRGLAVWRVCAIAPSFASGWWAFSSVSFCKSIIFRSFGRLGAPALTLLGDLAYQAAQAGGPGHARVVFISGTLRELSVALCRGNASGLAVW